MRTFRKNLIHFEFCNLQSAICIVVYLALLLVLTGHTAAWGAVGCDLNDPDRDVARLFPESTGYKTIYVSIVQKGGETLLAKVETRLGDKFHGIYETIDVPYTIYEIFAKRRRLAIYTALTRKASSAAFRSFYPSTLKKDQGLLHGVDDQQVCREVA